jgi:hypothetical protein
MVKFIQKNYLMIYSVESIGKVQEHPTVVFLFSIEVITWDVHLATASMVLRFGWNPYWLSYIVSCLHKTTVEPFKNYFF